MTTKKTESKSTDLTKIIHTDHNGVVVRAANENLEKGATGHIYHIFAGDTSWPIIFQKGAVKENGLNGITNEALLAILIDRTQVLDARFPCDENKAALKAMQEALSHFESRTANRISRNVEGTEVA